MDNKPTYEEIELAKTNWKNYSIKQLKRGEFVVELLVKGQWVRVGKRHHSIAESAKAEAWKMCDDQKHKYEDVRKHPDDVEYVYYKKYGHKWPKTRDIR